jgi:tRNA(fMet)-specific endonuclease VapC
LAVAGTPVGPNDLWLAAAAVTHGLALVTANVREFLRIPGLSVETWPAA